MNWINKLTGRPKVSVEVMADHVEMTSFHLIMGLQVCWTNRDDRPISIKDFYVRLYVRGRNKVPVNLYPLERFMRVPTQRGLQKPSLRPITIPTQGSYIEQIRFISQEVLDVPSGKYVVDIVVTDTNAASYSSRASIQVVSAIKYRLSEEWQLDYA